MKFKHLTEVAYTTRTGAKGVGLIIIEGGVAIMCNNHNELHNINPQDPHGYQYGFQLPLDPVKSGNFMFFKLLQEELDSILEKSTPQGKIFRRIYKEFDDLVFIGSIQKNIDECGKPSAVVTAMDMKYLKETGWKPVVIEQSAEEKIKHAQSKKKFG